MLQIRERELDLYTQNSRVIATKSALLCGIGFQGLLYARKGFAFDTNHLFYKHAYPLALVVLIGFSLLALLNFSMIAMLAPGARAALRRADPSARRVRTAALTTRRPQTRAPRAARRRPGVARARRLGRHLDRGGHHRVPHGLLLLWAGGARAARRPRRLRLGRGPLAADPAAAHDAERLLAALDRAPVAHRRPPVPRGGGEMRAARARQTGARARATSHPPPSDGPRAHTACPSGLVRPSSTHRARSHPRQWAPRTATRAADGLTPTIRRLAARSPPRCCRARLSAPTMRRPLMGPLAPCLRAASTLGRRAARRAAARLARCCARAARCARCRPR